MNEALPGRVEFVLSRTEESWSWRWAGLAAVVAELSDLVRRGTGRVVVERVVETLVVAVAADREHRVPLAGLVDRVLDLHVVACVGEPPDPVALADWLLRVQVDFAESPEVRLAPYATALGAAGLARYRREAVSRFAPLPVVGFGVPGRYDRTRWALLRVMEELAEHTGDVDLHVLVLGKDLSSGWQYLRVATALRDAGRSREAVEWVRRGAEATSWRGAAARLVDLAVDECLRVGWIEEAWRWRWDAFTGRPAADTYARLRSLSGDRWPRVRDRALALLPPAELRAVLSTELSAAHGTRVHEWLARAVDLLGPEAALLGPEAAATLAAELADRG
ncbi:hypothetical protein [Actinosynnema sp. NPDC020468]|uniref:hypothetical protein n=1 Tax=Actinosynnema sp. NPDC020468 TaxID=3154488 RepID=UPI0033D5C9C3